MKLSGFRMPQYRIEKKTEGDKVTYSPQILLGSNQTIKYNITDVRIMNTNDWLNLTDLGNSIHVTLSNQYWNTEKEAMKVIELYKEQVSKEPIYEYISLDVYPIHIEYSDAAYMIKEIESGT
ncbi:MAG TPA: hypothetical protein VK705_07030 [Ferruginibacter sp.]|jgi:hypothetical protein|nr:hypothetical protein [Ferruginibacter sp.]